MKASMKTSTRQHRFVKALEDVTKSVRYSSKRLLKRTTTRIHASRLLDGLNLLKTTPAKQQKLAVPNPADQVSNPITGHYLSKLYTTDHVPENYVGSVAIRKIRGKGWGIATTAAVTAGELLLVCSPLALVKGPAGQLPPLQSLVEEISNSPLTLQQRRVLQWLHDGQDRDMDDRPPVITNLAGVEPAADLDPEQIESIVQLNAYGHPHQDPVVSRLRGDPPVSVLGLWPEFSFLNHSCSPSAVHLLVADQMMVRATRDMGPKQEVTINYLGRGNLMPLDERQQDLQGSFGFSCSCPRCRLEARHHEDCAYTLAGIQQLLVQLQPDLSAAVAAQDRTSLNRLRRLLNKGLAELNNLQAELVLDRQAAMHLSAAAFDLWWAVMKADIALDPAAMSSMKSMATCLEIAGSVVPGCELHTLLASKLVVSASRVFGVRDHVTAEASMQGVEALRLRYGDVGMPMLQMLLATGAEVADELDSPQQAQAAGG